MRDSSIMQSDNRVLKEHSETMQTDSRVLRSHSKTMRATSLVAMTFLPISTVATVFGTDFFVPASDGFDVNPRFWVMFAFAVSLTVTVLSWWHLWAERREPRTPAKRGTREDEPRTTAS